MDTDQNENIQFFWNDTDPGFLILKLIGRLDLSTCKLFEQEVQGLLANDPKHLLLDLSQLNYMSSSGIGAIISLQRFLQRFDQKLHIYNIAQSVRKLFETVEVTNFFSIFNSKSDAIAKFE